MNVEIKTSNKVFLSGTVSSQPRFSHELYGEGFYEFILEVPRLSEQKDYIPVTISERLMGSDLAEGQKLSFYGQFRSFNKLVGDKSKLMLTVFVRDFAQDEEVGNPNVAELTGYVCKAPMYRTTPFNREICDVLLAVNRAYDKSDYIPCIAWGRNARFVKEIAVGQKLSVSGRIQSREYNKRLDSGEMETRTAYELSINKIFMEEDARE
ncbi:MAG: single-stranded DNA-binding protein [Clostridia bacterium]|nr:single-stranded DNA-binding protein [Clostridia bacterium]